MSLNNAYVLTPGNAEIRLFSTAVHCSQEPDKLRMYMACLGPRSRAMLGLTADGISGKRLAAKGHDRALPLP